MNSWCFWERSIPRNMRINDRKLLTQLAELGVELRPATKLSEWTSLGIGGTTDLLRISNHESILGHQISFEYRHTSFAPDDMMLAVILELPSKPYNEILKGIRICNEKRRSSQPLGQKSAGCIFKNPPGASAGRMIDELGLKGLSVGDAQVSDRHANFFVNAGHASAKDMLALIAGVRERVQENFAVKLENEVVVWNA